LSSLSLHWRVAPLIVMTRLATSRTPKESPTMRTTFRVCFLATFSVLCVLQLVSAQQRGRRGQGNQDQTNPPAGQAQPPVQPQPRGIQPKVFAITGARVIPEPGKSIDKATVVIRN